MDLGQKYDEVDKRTMEEALKIYGVEVKLLGTASAVLRGPSGKRKNYREKRAQVSQ